VHLVVIDLIPALLSWEGRDRSAEPSVAVDAIGALEHLSLHFGIAGVADAGHTSEALRVHLEREHLAVYFESVGTSAEFGPTVSPRVVRRMARGMRLGLRDLVLVTARPAIATGMKSARVRTVLTSHDEFGAVDEAVEALLGGRVSP
jgi:hypothetical protein